MKTFKIVIFLMVLSTVCTLFLATGNYAYEKFSAIFNVRLYGTILEMFEKDVPEDRVEEVFLDNFDITTVGDTTYYISKGELEAGTVVFKHDGPGLWSNIEILLAIKANRKNLLKELSLYTDTHFTEEEELFKKSEYPHTEKHLEEHKYFIDKLSDFDNNLQLNNASVSLNILEFLKNWLFYHIEIVDKGYALYVKKVIRDY